METSKTYDKFNTAWNEFFELKEHDQLENMREHDLTSLKAVYPKIRDEEL
jgi:hypothetical protein